MAKHEVKRYDVMVGGKWGVAGGGGGRGEGGGTKY